MTLQPLLPVLPEVVSGLTHARRILLLADFDGTLAPIVQRPENAGIDGETRKLLEDLALDCRIVLGIISGRSLTDLRHRVGVSGVTYAGNHGLEIEGPGISFVNPAARDLAPVLDIMYGVMSRSLEKVPGVIVENKGLTLTIHYRMAHEDQFDEIEHIVLQVAGGAVAAGKARLTSGKKVLEVRPAVAWDKGRAIKLLMKKYGRGGRRSGLVPVYLGDDTTDEDGFRVIRKYGLGVSVFVGETPEESAAQYRLESPSGVSLFLGALRQALAAGDGSTTSPADGTIISDK